MSVTINDLSTNLQQYIETIYALCNQDEHAHTKEIADALGISMPSVTEALQTLGRMELINYKARQAVTLTESGFCIGKELHYRHKIFAEFLNSILGFDSAESDEIACKVEHVIDDKVRKRLSDFMLFLKKESQFGYNGIVEKFLKTILK